MKVEVQEQQKFEPITITLTIESAEELCNLFHRCNVNSGLLEEHYIKTNQHVMLKHGVNSSDAPLYETLKPFIESRNMRI